MVSISRRTQGNSDELRKECPGRNNDRIVSAEAVRIDKRFVKHNLKRMTRPGHALVVAETMGQMRVRCLDLHDEPRLPIAGDTSPFW